MKRQRFAASTGLALAATAIIAGGLSGLVQQVRQKNLYKEQFTGLTSEFTGRISQRFHLYEYGLRGARGAVITGGRQAMLRPQFEEYFASREQEREFPGARGIGYIARVPHASSLSFAEAARADNFPTFAIRELAPNSGERFVIQYIYPLAGNGGATGLDIASEANRRAAALAAARSGQPRLTAPITLVQASGEKDHGFLLLLPVYRAGAYPDTADGRLAATIGWTYSPLVVSEVLRDLGPRRDEIAFALTDNGLGNGKRGGILPVAGLRSA